MRILPCGERALLLEFDTLDESLAAAARLDAARESGLPQWGGVADVVPAARTVLVTARGLPGLAAAIERLLAADAADAPVPPPPEEVVVPIRYDGDDLADVARLTGLTVAEVVAAHTGTPWRVGFGGFAPGFAYLADGDPRLRVPRLASPRTRVPAGAVALADGFSGIYPTPSPGGWRLLGRTDAVLFDVDRTPPALLRPGMLVRFVAVDALRSRPSAARAEAAPAGGRGLEIVETRFPILVQDRGRPGSGAVGVGASGASDRGAYELGARLVGNGTGEAALEVTLGGATLRAHGACTAVLTGAACPAEAGGRPVSHQTLFVLGDGETLTLGAPPAGLRTYLSVHGGVDVAPVLGSRSRDTLGGIGPSPLRAGDRVPLGASAPGWTPGVGFVPYSAARPAEVELAYLPGPRSDWADGLAGSAWTVGNDVDRVGVRLTGPALGRRGGELPSEGVVLGAVQLPPSGEPVLFLADHPPTGGYPVIGVLTAESADRAAQLRPGDRCRLVPFWHSA